MATPSPRGPRRAPVAPSVLDEQLAYYRARAGEYDQWFLRQGRYDRGEAATAAWRRELDEVRGWLAGLGIEGAEVLELAAGTGLWTRELLALGARVTALDAAPEMLEQLAARLGDVGGEALRIVHADCFEWSAPIPFDAVVACFLVSHVPDERLDAFMALLAAAAAPGGRVFLLDSLRAEDSTAADHVLPAADDQTMDRVLNDGRRFRIVKRFRADAELLEAAGRHGMAAEVRTTATYFQALLATVA